MSREYEPGSALSGGSHRRRSGTDRPQPRGVQAFPHRVRRQPPSRKRHAVSVVELAGVTKRFERGGTVALEGIDLTIETGEFTSLIGPSGCGKSTLLRVIGDLIPPTAGRVTVNGKSAHQARLDRDYGIVFQNAVLYDWRTVTKNIALPLEMLGWSRTRRAERIREMVELGELSFSPPLLLMDEPFGALDEMTRERLNMELLRIWQETASTIVFITHSIAEAVFLSTRVVVMSPRPGRIAEIVDVDLAQPRTAATREDPRYFELVTAVREALARGGAARAVERELVAGEEP